MTRLTGRRSRFVLPLGGDGMRKYAKWTAVLVAAITAGLLTIPLAAPPAAAHIQCGAKHNRFESHITVTNNATGTLHRGYRAIATELSSDCQNWRYVVHMWCTYDTVNGAELAEKCNYDAQNTAPIIKTCYASPITTPWGTADRNQQDSYDVVFLGAWHNPLDGACDGIAYTPYIAVRTSTAWRFLLFNDYLTAHYCGVNAWHSAVWNYGDQAAPTQTGCESV